MLATDKVIMKTRLLINFMLANFFLCTAQADAQTFSLPKPEEISKFTAVSGTFTQKTFGEFLQKLTPYNGRYGGMVLSIANGSVELKDGTVLQWRTADYHTLSIWDEAHKKGSGFFVLKPEFAPPNVRNIKFEVRADKDSFAVDEALTITLTLTNNDKFAWTMDRFNSNFDGMGHRSFFEFRVVRDGAALAQDYIHSEQKMDMVVNFQPQKLDVGESVTFKVTLNKWYDLSKAGKYSIVCDHLYKFSSKENGQPFTVMGTMKSQPIEITIK
jgi:hypothetical protein